MRKTSFIVLLLLLAGCGSSLDKSYSNFTAYYNTFYNAKVDFKAGLSAVHKQPVNIDPDQPVLPHPIPPSAGVQDFENAVDNAAEILRRFPDSKWTDDALLLMGKSYYYLQEYFLARQKFEELLALTRQSTLKQQAVIWKARTLLAIKDHVGGIQFLKSALEDSTEKWTVNNKAEARVLLAAHHAMLSHWEEVTAILEPANLRLDERPLRGRSYFLLGQAFDRTGQLNLAFQAYSNVPRNFPNYEYIYHAEVKRANVANRLGNGELAISIYQKMLNDDKYYNRHNEISYQLAQVYEGANDFTEARRLYLRILNNSTDASGQVRSNTYYKLGQLYSRHFQDYELAAAYFDSSSIQTQQQSAEADRLASAYNRYISLREQISRIDSLLALGALNDNELTIKLAEVRQQRQEMLKQSGNQIQQTNNILSNVEEETIYNDQEPPESNGYGFLNYRNRQLMQRERQQFRAVWGDRPLVDNWRRAATISAQDISEQDSREDDSASIPNQQLVENDNQLGIDVNEIPRSTETRRELTEKSLKAQYQLGSLFFLTLQEADSAAYYYHGILQDSIANDLRVQTLYSLYELHNLQEQPDSMAKYKKIILESYPETLYAEKIRDTQWKGELGEFTKKDSLLILRKKVQELLMQRDNQPSVEHADQLVILARENQSSPLAPKILYESIREYILYARYKDDTATTDSSNIAVSDSVNTTAYSGPYWNRVRMLINEFLERYRETPLGEQVQIWDDMLNNSLHGGSTTSCTELGIEPAIKPSKEAFLDTITLPERVKGMNISGSIRYRVTIEGDGTVHSYELLSKSTNLGIEEVFNEAIGQSLRFEPIQENGNSVQVTCEVIFPIRQ